MKNPIPQARDWARRKAVAVLRYLAAHKWARWAGAVVVLLAAWGFWLGTVSLSAPSILTTPSTSRTESQPTPRRSTVKGADLAKRTSQSMNSVLSDAPAGTPMSVVVASALDDGSSPLGVADADLQQRIHEAAASKSVDAKRAAALENSLKEWTTQVWAAGVKAAAEQFGGKRMNLAQVMPAIDAMEDRPAQCAALVASMQTDPSDRPATRKGYVAAAEAADSVDGDFTACVSAMSPEQQAELPQTMED